MSITHGFDSKKNDNVEENMHHTQSRGEPMHSRSSFTVKLYVYQTCNASKTMSLCTLVCAMAYEQQPTTIKDP